MRKRRFIHIWFGIILVLILLAGGISSGCSPASGGTLSVGVLNFPRSQNPFIGSDADTIAYMPVYEPLLTHHGVTGEIMPLIAKTWEYDAASISWTFHIDPRAKFNDGTEVTAEDVKYSWETNWTVAAKNAAADALTKSIEVVDSKTVKFNLEGPTSNYLEYMGQTYIVPKAIWSAVADIMTYANADPVGSGPMFWTEYVTDSHCTFAKNPDYWMGTVNIDTLYMKYYSSVDGQLLALQLGDIDTVNKLQMNSAVPTLVRDPDIAVAWADLNYSQQLLMNHRITLLGMRDFRQAMNVIIDRNGMVTVVAEGYGKTPLQVPIAPTVAAANKDTIWPWADNTQAERIVAANTLLDGITGMTTIANGDGTYRKYDGEVVDLSVMVSSTNPTSLRTAELIQSSCALVGIKITIDAQSFITAFRAAYRNGGDLEKLVAWDMFITGAPLTPSFTSFNTSWSNPEPAPLAEGGVWASRLQQSEAAGWTSPVIQGKFTAQQAELDDVARLAIQQEIQTLWAAEVPMLIMYHTITPIPYRTDKFTDWIEDMPTVLYNKNVEGYWSPYHLISIKPVS